MERTDRQHANARTTGLRAIAQLALRAKLAKTALLIARCGLATFVDPEATATMILEPSRCRANVLTDILEIVVRQHARVLTTTLRAQVMAFAQVLEVM